MEQRAYWKEFARYAFLSVLGTLGVSCYILADTFFIAKGMGTNGLAALNLAIPVYNVIHGVGLMLGMGGATRFSIYKSQGEHKRADLVFTNTVMMAAGFSVLFMMAGAFFPEQTALLLGADSNILQMTTTYLNCLLLFAPAFIMNNILLCFVRNDNAPSMASIAMLIGSFSNIVLDYIFIFPFDMGIFGAVFATGLSPVISIVLMSPHWLKKEKGFHLIRTSFKPDISGRIVSIGFPSLVAQLATGIAMMIFNVLILSLEGNVGVAAYGVIANIALVTTGIYTGISQGVQPLMSSAYGMGDEKKLHLSLRYAIITMLVISAAIYAVLFLFAEPIAGAFNSENSRKLQEMAVEGLKIYFLSLVFVGFNTIISVYFTSTEKMIPAHVLSLMRAFILLVPAAFLLSALWKMTGIWITCPVTELLAALPGWLIYRKGIQKKKGESYNADS